MSAHANPVAIGAFLVGAIVLGVAGTAVLGSAHWFRQESQFVSLFSESVNGLVSGAPVKFQGVPVGTVTDLMIQIDRVGKTFQVPVLYTVDLTRLRTVSGTFVNLADSSVRAQQIANGLRVRLQMESFVTGQLYLELSYDSAAAEPVLESRATEWSELPTSRSMMAALGSSAGGAVADVVKVLFRVNAMLAEVDMAEINASVTGAARAVQRLADAPAIRTALAQIPEATAQATQTMAAIERLAVTTDSTMQPLGAHATRVTGELTAALRAFEQTMQETQGLLSTDTGIGFELRAAMTSLKNAAEALQLLTTTLEQTPDILLRGKRPPARLP